MQAALFQHENTGSWLALLVSLVRLHALSGSVNIALSKLFRCLDDTTSRLGLCNFFRTSTVLALLACLGRSCTF
jgi:hypothetical protein